MSKFINRLAAVAALALAATPIVGLAAAHAAERGQPEVRIQIGDLRLSRPADAAMGAARARTNAQPTPTRKTLRLVTFPPLRSARPSATPALLPMTRLPTLCQRTGPRANLSSRLLNSLRCPSNSRP